jgi:hypothetical protein
MKYLNFTPDAMLRGQAGAGILHEHKMSVWLVHPVRDKRGIELKPIYSMKVVISGASNGIDYADKKI